MFREGIEIGTRPGAAARRLGPPLAASFMVVSSLVIAGSAAPAHAHVELVSSSPESGAEVPLELDRVELVFGENLFPLGSDISVRGPDGEVVTIGEPTVFGAELEAPIALVAGGRHRLFYRAVGEDGHVITGHLRFTVAAEGVPLPTAAAARHVGAGGTADVGAPDGGARVPSPVTSGVWLVGAALGFGGLVIFMRATRRTAVAAQRRPDDGATPRARNEL